MSIFEWINRLQKESEIKEELHEIVKKASYFLVSDTSGIIKDDYENLALALADGFIIALHQRQVSEHILTFSDLERALRRWVTQRDAVQKHELWELLSDKLRDLEKRKKVCRMDSAKGRNNSNNTPWSLPKYVSEKGIVPKQDEVRGILPKIKAKGERDRILKPDEAEDLLLSLLGLAKGTLLMEEIVNTIEPHVPMLRVKSSLDEEIKDTSTTSEGGGFSLGDVTGDRRYLDDDHLLIQDEVMYRVPKIWNLVGQIKRGRKVTVTGHKVLCEYFLPKHVFSQKPDLGDLQGEGTVNDVENDIRKIFKEWLPSPPFQGGDREEWVGLQIVRKVSEELCELCSENGCDTALYE